MVSDFTIVTELAGDPASREQIERLRRRYYWCGRHAAGRDVLEVACGAGQGLGYLASMSRSIIGGDLSAPVLSTAKSHYGSRVPLLRFDAEFLPFTDSSFDLVVCFEAIYYLRDAEHFLRECRRVLRAGGVLLISSANRDLSDFTPSAHSTQYFGVPQLDALLRASGFSTNFLGDTDVTRVSLRQRVLRPLKAIATSAGLMPRSKQLKAVLKRLMFGSIAYLPPEVVAGYDAGMPLAPISSTAPDRRHKVICCEARCISS